MKPIVPFPLGIFFALLLCPYHVVHTCINNYYYMHRVAVSVCGMYKPRQFCVVRLMRHILKSSHSHLRTCGHSCSYFTNGNDIILVLSSTHYMYVDSLHVLGHCMHASTLHYICNYGDPLPDPLGLCWMNEVHNKNSN